MKINTPTDIVSRGFKIGESDFDKLKGKSKELGVSIAVLLHYFVSSTEFENLTTFLQSKKDG
ncbi:hypothetical protein [Crocosphaera watsonii]|uniref:Uncharacterized protein n=1 Tax=Crocosphaera watsonii WH 0401 TaxID=555881 RepID=T2JAU1_CROWT|nr:hypothetical protein [Crocosphaera watsonii]CCQ62261.1 hypothetical protein CWATWH0401_2995 [Crocosphaera watsonii WH 0401]